MQTNKHIQIHILTFFPLLLSTAPNNNYLTYRFICKMDTPFTCTICTFINTSGSRCEMCDSVRAPAPMEADTEIGSDAALVPLPASTSNIEVPLTSSSVVNDSSSNHKTLYSDLYPLPNVEILDRLDCS